MAKKTYGKRKRRDNEFQIDHIPKYSQQRRSPGGPKRRTDFSLFFCSSSSSSSLSNASLPQDLLLESPSSKAILSSATIAGCSETKDTRRDTLELPLVQCTESLDKRKEFVTNHVEVPTVDVDSVAPSSPFEPWSNRNADKQRSVTPDKSQTTEGNDVCTTPGSVGSAKTACQLWWPAEILEEKSTLVSSSNQGSIGHVLVQYRGNQDSAWVDPARDLSQFEDCFEERICNPMDEFQDALKQALHHKEHLSSCKQLFHSLTEPDCLNQRDQSPDKLNSSSSSRTESDYLGRGRSKRERKPKVHFDEVTFPLKSTRKVRRFRIMRFLGLAAPIGSPFSFSPYRLSLQH